jgi:nitroreductase
MDLRDTLRSTGAARTFTDRPVDDATVHSVLDTARFAPSGGNRQPWRVAVVRDPVIRRTMAALMQSVWNDYVGVAATGATPFAFGAAPSSPPIPTPNPLLDEIESVPVVLAVAADLGQIALMDGMLDRPALTGGASVYPFCWSILLAARQHGLGGVITTFLSRAERDAAAPLGLPAGHALAATVFLGHPVHQSTRLRRRPVEEFTTVDRFDGPTFTT